MAISSELSILATMLSIVICVMVVWIVIKLITCRIRNVTFLDLGIPLGFLALSVATLIGPVLVFLIIKLLR